MPSIEDQALQIYQNNLTYLQSYQPRVYEKLAAFDSAVVNGHYSEKYDLEYKEEGYFDVKEIKSGNYLYGSNTIEYAKMIAKSIDYKKEDNIFIVAPRYNFSKEFLKKAKYEPIDANNLSAVALIIDLINRQIPPNSTMKKHEKFIFFGVGLGTHLKSIDEKINSDFYLIVEDDLELFRLSLFVTDYSKLAKNSELYFCIFEEDSSSKVIMEYFLEDGFMHNHYIKFLHMLHHSEDRMKNFQEVSASQRHILFPYHAYFHKFLRPLDYLKEGYKFLSLIPKSFPFANKPVLILAAGPSLSKNLAWVKKHHDNFITIALTSSLATLEKEDIIPDIVTHLDPFEGCSLPHLQKIKNSDYFTKPICLFGSQSPKGVVDLFKKEHIFFFESGTEYKKDFGSITAPCIGTMSYALSLVLGAKDIYLLGLDLAIDEKSGSTHSSDHAHAKTLDINNVDRLEEKFSFKTSIIKVKGNFHDEVLTTANFYISIESAIKNYAKYHKSYQTVYNLNDGAYLNGAIPTKIEEVKVKNSVDKKNLIKDFNSISSDVLTDKEIKSIETMNQHAKSVKTILHKHKTRNFNSPQEYQYNLMGLSLDLTADSSLEASSLNIVLLKYMQYIYPYIFDYLNTKEIKEYKKTVKKIDKLLIESMLKIIKEFEKKFELFLEEEIA